MNEQQLRELYDWISTQDPTYQERYTFEAFASKIANQDYANQLGDWAASYDPQKGQQIKAIASMPTQPLAQQQPTQDPATVVGEALQVGMDILKKKDGTESVSADGSLEPPTTEAKLPELIYGIDLGEHTPRDTRETGYRDPLTYLPDELLKGYEFVSEEQRIQASEAAFMEAKRRSEADKAYTQKQIELEQPSLTEAQKKESKEKFQERLDYAKRLTEDAQLGGDIEALRQMQPSDNSSEVIDSLNSRFNRYGVAFTPSTSGVGIVATSKKNGESLAFNFQSRRYAPAMFSYGTQSTDNIDELSSKLQDFIRVNGTLEPLRTEEEQEALDLVDQAYRIRASRKTHRQNPDGSTSTVLMASGEQDGKFIAFPTLFPKNPNLYNSNPYHWMELEGDAALEEARRRNEVYFFDTEEEAQSFAEGGWKDVSLADKQYEKVFAERGLDFRLIKDADDNFDRIGEDLDFIERAPLYLNELSEEEQERYGEYYIDGKRRNDLDKIAAKLDDERAGFARLLFNEDVTRAQQDADEITQEQLITAASLGAEYNAIYKEYETKLDEESKKYLGVGLSELGTYVPKDEREAKILDNINTLYEDAKAVKAESAKQYEIANTYYDNKFNKDFYGEWVDGFRGVMNEWRKGLSRGYAIEGLLKIATGMTDIDDDVTGQEFAEKYVQHIEDMQTGKTSREMAIWQDARTMQEMKLALQSGSLWGAVQFSANSIGMMLPYGWKIYATTVPLTTLGGVISGIPGGPPGMIAGGKGGFDVGVGIAGGASGLALEYGNSVMEAMDQMNVDVTNPDQVLEALRGEEVWDYANDIGVKRGLTIGIASAFGNAMAGRVFRVGSLASAPKKLAVAGVSATAVSPVVEGVGEAAAQIVSNQYDGEVRIKEVIEEMVGSFGMVGTSFSTAAIGNYLGTKIRSDIKLANNLADIGFISRERSTDLEITRWANNMERLGKITPELNQRIQENVGLRRQAREILKTGSRRGGVGVGEKAIRSKVEERIMQLLAAKEEYSSTETRKSVFKEKIRAINEELATIADKKKLVAEEDQVPLSSVVSDQGVTATSDIRPTVKTYSINGKSFSKEVFFDRLADMSVNQRKRARVRVINDSSRQTAKRLIDLGVIKMPKEATVLAPPRPTSEATPEQADPRVAELEKERQQKLQEVDAVDEMTKDDKAAFLADPKKFYMDQIDRINKELEQNPDADVNPDFYESKLKEVEDIYAEYDAKIAALPEVEAAPTITEVTQTPEGERIVPRSVEPIARPTRTDKQQFENNTLPEVRLEGILSAIVDKLRTNKKLTPFQEKVANANSEKLAEITDRIEKEDEIDQEVRDMEALFKKEDPSFQLDTSLTPQEKREALYKEALNRLSELDNPQALADESFSVEEITPDTKTIKITVKENTVLADKVKKVGLDFLIGKKINLVMADQLTTDPNFDPNDPNRLMGGNFFPLLDQLFGKVAWASINKSAAATIVNGAIDADYSVVFNMSPKAVYSNKAFANAIIDSLTPKQRKEYYAAIKKYVQTTKKSNWKKAVRENSTLESFLEHVGSKKFSTDNRIELFEAILPEQGIASTTAPTKYLQGLGITSNTITDKISEKFAMDLPMGALTMILEVTDKQGNKVTAKTKSEAIITPEQQKEEGLPTHPNYDIYIRGRAVAMLNETTEFWNVANPTEGEIERQETVYLGIPKTEAPKAKKGVRIYSRGDQSAILLTADKNIATKMGGGTNNSKVYTINILNAKIEGLFDISNPEHVKQLRAGFRSEKQYDAAINKMRDNRTWDTIGKYASYIKRAGFEGAVFVDDGGKKGLVKGYALFQDELDVTEKKSGSTIDVIMAKIAGYLRKGGGVMYTAKEAFANAYRGAQMAANVVYDVVKPMTNDYARFVSLLSKSFPNVEVVTSEQEFNALIDEFYARELLTAKTQKVYGFVYEGKLYLNPALANYNTPIHEFGHIWMNVAKNMRPDLYDKGIELIQTEGKEYVDQIRNSERYKKVLEKLRKEGMTEAEVERYILEEALATAIGDKGEAITKAAFKDTLKGWINRLFNFVKSLTGISKYNAQQLQDITMGQFLEGVVVDLLSGKPLFENAEANQMSEQVQFMTDEEPANMSMFDFIKYAREGQFKDESIKIFLIRQGFEVRDIDAALAVPANVFTNVPPAFGNVNGGIVEGINLYQRVMDLVTRWKKADNRKKLNDLVSILKKQGFSNAAIAEIKKTKKVDLKAIYDYEKQAIEEVRSRQKEEADLIREVRDNDLKEAKDKKARAAIREKAKTDIAALNVRYNKEVDQIRVITKESIDAARKNNRESLGEIREKAQIFLQEDALFKTLDRNLQMQLSVGLDNSLGITENRKVTDDMRRMRAAIRDNKRLTRDLNKIKADLRVLIRKYMPRSMWTSSDVNKLMAIIARATPRNIEVAFSDAVEIINKQLTKDAFKLINKFKNTKTERIVSGRVKGVFMAMGVDRVNLLKRDISIPLNLEDAEIKQMRKDGMSNQAIDKRKIEKVNDKIESLRKELQQLQDLNNPTAFDQDRMGDIAIAILYNEALLLDDADSVKADNLNAVAAELNAILKQERSMFAGVQEVRRRKLNRLKSKFFTSVTGLDADFNSEESVDENTDAVRRRQNLKDNRNKVKRWLLRMLLTLQDIVVTRTEALSGTLDLISRENAKMFEGTAQEILLDLIDESTRNYYAGSMQIIAVIEQKMKDFYGKNYAKVVKQNSRKNTKVYTDPKLVAQLREELKAETDPKRIAEIEREISSVTQVMSQNEMYYLYNQFKDPANHPGFETKFGSNYREVMADIESKLDPIVKDWADYQVDVLFPELYSRYNPVYRNLYYTNMPWNQNYAGRIIRENDNADIDMINAGDTGYRNAIGNESTKVRRQNKKAIETIDGDAILMAYIDDMEYFRAYAENMKTVVGIFRDKLVKDGIIATSYKGAYEIINDKFSKILNRKLAATGINSQLYNYLTGAYVVSKLGVNPTVYLKQLTSALAFADYIGYGSWTTYALMESKNGFFGWSTTWQEMYANSPILQKRYDNDSFTKVLESYSTDAAQSVVDKHSIDKVMNFLTYLIKKGDQGGVMGSIPNYAFYKNQFLEENPSATEQDAINFAIKKVEREINETQQSNINQYKDFYQTDNVVYRWLSLFTSSVRALLRKEIYSVRQLTRKLRGMPSKGTTWQNVRTFMTYHFAIPMLFQFVAAGFPGLLRPWREDDAEELGRAALIGNLNGFFIVGDILKSISDTVGDKPWAGDMRTVPMLEMAGDIITNFAKYKKAKTPETKDKYMKRMLNSFIEVSGIPATQLTKLYSNYTKLPAAVNEREFGEALLRLFNYSDYVIEGAPDRSRRKSKGLDLNTREGMREAIMGDQPTRKEMREMIIGDQPTRKEMREMMMGQ